jgi:hypothetical protein
MAKGIYGGGKAVTGFIPDPAASPGSVQATQQTGVEQESVKRLRILGATPLRGTDREITSSGAAAISGTRLSGGTRISGGSV